jgi:hypothetical protein
VLSRSRRTLSVREGKKSAVPNGRNEMATRQLAERSGDGIVVELFWDDSAPAGSELFVEYKDEREQVSYTLYPPRDRALEAFYYPEVYARRAGIVPSGPS